MRRWQHRLHCGQDRPRSRGVYTSGSRCSLENHGSSPLARGLHGRPLAPQPVNGIIPARAGFTRPAGAPRGARPDHPRSRGVYAKEIGAATPKDGSSPLARGLRASPAASPLGTRIIPARAGFTPASSRHSLPTPDHPRSRGVYFELLADRFADCRIIPARAGFTSPAPPDPWQPADHPRSRGVYAGETVPVARHLGSSPLARGLRRRCWARPTAAGIIPARAGFTPDD